MTSKEQDAGTPTPAPAPSDTYPMPKHGWTCFHCGDTFTTPGAARDHFGPTIDCAAGCQIKAGDERGLLMALRKVEEELTRYRAEDSDKVREFYAMRSAHSQALIKAEQTGYDSGLKDYAKLDAELSALRAAHEAAVCTAAQWEAEFNKNEARNIELEQKLEAAQAEIAVLRVNDARYKARRTAIFQMRLRTEIPGYRNWKPTTVEEFNAEYDAACDKEVLEQDAERKAK